MIPHITTTLRTKTIGSISPLRGKSPLEPLKGIEVGLKEMIASCVL